MSTWLMPLIFISLINYCLSSAGDLSPFYSRCVRECVKNVCDKGQQHTLNENLFSLGVSLWSCPEDCEYRCQWSTVDAFEKHNYSIPKFYGKWPFMRLLGLAEPASVIFSMFNFAVHLKMMMVYRQQFSAKTPYYYIWHINTLVNLNAWFWSSVFHTRDTKLTEKMDYISAFCVVLFSLYTMGLRYISSLVSIKSFLWSFFCSSLALNHIYYLWSERFDYGYNMLLNCVIGFATVLGWLMWAVTHYRSQPHTWWVAVGSLCLALSASLELLDFPPILWTFDAHSLWHLATGFIAPLFYKFISLDSEHLTRHLHEHVD